MKRCPQSIVFLLILCLTVSPILVACNTGREAYVPEEPETSLSTHPETSPPATTSQESSEESKPDPAEESSSDISSTSSDQPASQSQPIKAQAVNMQQPANDFEYITDHINLWLPQQLTVYLPAGDVKTDLKNYCITGSSNPNSELFLNGEPVTGRGILGSFSIYVPLSQGINTFELRQGDNIKTITIDQSPSYSSAATTNVITSMFPSYNIGVKSGQQSTIKCVAPSGSSVSANIGGEVISLVQRAQAKVGVPAVFSAEYYPPEVSGTKDFGKVTYTLNYNGQTKNFTSAGKVMVTGSSSYMAIEVENVCSTIYSGNTTNTGFLSTAKKGGIDYVTGYADGMYRLSMGGWIGADTVRPLAGGADDNRVTSAVYTSVNAREAVILSGTSHPMYKARRDNSVFSITLYGTTGIGNIDASSSKLFTQISASEQEGNTTIDFTIKPGSFGGYLVEYNEGKTIIYFKEKPSASQGGKPLAGLTIGIDPGHGGNDTGALGIPHVQGPTEKQINLATAIALKKRLELQGATVVMTRTGDGRPDLNQRLIKAEENWVDLFISIHCNSVPYNRDYTKPNGVEVYYYDNASKPLAQKMAANIASYTGRQSRGAMNSNFRVTLNSHAPSVLVEMGFMMNAVEYDSMRSRRGIYNTVNAISDSIISFLS